MIHRYTSEDNIHDLRSSSLHEIMGSGQRKGRELAQLIVQQQKDHQDELQSRDEQIAKFQTLFQQVEIKQAESQKDFEKRLQEITKKDQHFITKIKEKLAQGGH